jgi:GAF domain-containing protein
VSDLNDESELTPITQTREAFDWLSVYGGTELEEWMTGLTARIKEIAPSCVAVSVTLQDGDLTFTFSANRRGAALLDAVQYLDGGPCIKAIEDDEIEATDCLATDEGQWRMFAAAEALTGIASTLSMPLMNGSDVVGGVNLYGAAKDTFDGSHEELAAACGSWAATAVTNADLRFTSRVRAAATRDRLQDRGDVDMAAGVVAEHQQTTTERARARMHDAAVRAGVSVPEFARFLLESHASELS